MDGRAAHWLPIGGDAPAVPRQRVALHLEHSEHSPVSEYGEYGEYRVYKENSTVSMVQSV